MFLYCKEDPFFVAVNCGNNNRNWEMHIWPDSGAKGGFRAKIDCQTHDIDEWRENGRVFIAAEVVTLTVSEYGIDDDDIAGLFFNDKSEEAMALLTKLRADLAGKHKEAIAEVNQLYDLLLASLQYSVDVITQHNAKYGPPPKAKTKKKKTTKAA